MCDTDRGRSVVSASVGRLASRNSTNSARNSSTSGSKVSCITTPVLVGDDRAVLGRAAEHQLADLGPLERELDIVLPGEAHAAEELQAVPEYHRLAFSRSGFRHRRGQPPARVVGADRQRREVGQRAGPLDRDVHVHRLVLHGLKRPDRHAELMPVPHMRQHQVEGPLAGAHRRDRDAHERDVVRPLGIRVHPVVLAHPHVRKRHIGDVQHRVEHLGAGDLGVRRVDDEGPAVGDHRELLRAVTVET